MVFGPVNLVFILINCIQLKELKAYMLIAKNFRPNDEKNVRLDNMERLRIPR